MSLSECAVSFLIDKRRQEPNLSLIEIQNQILAVLSSLPPSVGFAVTKTLDSADSSDSRPEMAVLLKVKPECKMIHVIYAVLLHILDNCVGLSVTVRVNKHLIFSEDFECQDLNIEVSRVSFGMVYLQNYYVHHVLDPGRYAEKHLRNKGRWPMPWKCYVNEFQDHVFRLDCMHDKQHIQLRIPMIDLGDIDRQRARKQLMQQQSQNQDNGEPSVFPGVSQKVVQHGPPGERRYYNDIGIKLLYENVMKMNVDVWRIEHDRAGNEYIHATLFFHYKNTPSVYVRFVDERRTTPGRFVRYINWSEDFSIGNFLASMYGSTVMAVSIYSKHDEFTRLMYQLHDLMHCKLHFRRHFEMDPHNFVPIPDEYYYSWPFSVRYLVDAILSNGFPGQVRLCGDENVMWRLVDKIDEYLDNKKVESAERKLVKIFFEVIQDSEIIDNMQMEQYHSKATTLKDDSFENIRKLIITPTRILLYPAEPIMGSRIVRKLGADRVIRVVFRDDTMDTMRSMTCPPHVINDVVDYYLKCGLKIAGEQYYFLGYSNSQLRDHGCYFLRTDDKNEVTNILVTMGTFKDEGVAKTMARFAQCFTQTKTSKVKLNPGNCAEIGDNQSCACDSHGKPYCFSDGCGQISYTRALQLMKETNTFDTGCFQFRRGGNKGVLAVDPLLDKMQCWLNENGITEPENKLMKCDVLFRTSQNKFTAKNDDDGLEIVKISTAVPVRLNKPLINIYDQVSEKQSPLTHERIKKRTVELASDHVTDVLMSLTEDSCFRNALAEIPVYAPVNKLLSYTTLLDEPFFRSMVMARAKASLKQLNEKKQINVPYNLGRCMFGIADPYGILQYGQVFVQYSRDVYDLSQNRSRTILKGPVVISKNPMCNSGDLRMFEAVDIPALRHLVDNVVFPQYGPRPHADEMAGSDLDGDEFSVIWDPELFIDYNEPAFNYTPPKGDVKSVNIDELIDASTDFFVNYMSMDMIGQIANAHLMNADLYGLDSEVCRTIAEKQMIAVDFAKTGVPMTSLTRDWTDGMPPERVERHPDFMQKDYLPTYESPRLLGHLHRKISKFYNTLSTVISNLSEKPVIDPAIDFPGWERYKDLAASTYSKYSNELDHLILAYGVVNEGELFSQQFTVLKNRLNARETDNMSGFTTATLIQLQVFNIFRRYRTEFFSQFGVELNPQRQKDIIRDKNFAKPEMKMLAVAMYKLAYSSGVYLSFPWIAWDVIDQIRCDSRPPLKIDPVGERVSLEIANKRFNKYDEFKRRLLEHAEALGPYLERYTGLGELLYFLMKWKDQQCFLNVLSKPMLSLIFIKFGLGLLPPPKGFYPFLEVTDKENQGEVVDIRENAGGLGRKLIWFFASIGSDEFLELETCDFETPNLGPNKAVYHRQTWVHIHEAGLIAYLNICCKIQPDVLLPYNVDGVSEKSSHQIIKNPNPFVIEVPSEMKDAFEKAIPVIERLSGCQKIAYDVPEVPTFIQKRMNQNPNVKITLWPRGTPSQINALRNMLTIRPTLTRGEKPLETAKRLGEMVMEKVTAIINSSNLPPE